MPEGTLRRVRDLRGFSAMVESERQRARRGWPVWRWRWVNGVPPPVVAAVAVAALVLGALGTSVVAGLVPQVVHVVVLGVLLAGTAAWWVARRAVPPRTAEELAEVRDPAERLRLQDARDQQRNTLLTGLVQAVGLLGIVGGTFVAWQGLALERAALKSTREVTLSGQQAERFTRAVEQLGNGNPDVRLGGIYALEQLAKDDPKSYRATAAEVLTAFVRSHAPWPPPDSAYEADVSTDELRELQVRAADAQTAMTVLGRPPEGRQSRVLDLHSVDLRRANLTGVQLQGAILFGAQLQGVSLSKAQLQGADLDGAQLQGARLDWAQLQRAKLTGAQLQCAILTGAQLQCASLTGAQLQGADLKNAKLRGAILFGAQLQGARLVDAQLQGAFLNGAQLQGASLNGAQLQGAKLTGAQLQGATLPGATADETTEWPEGWDRPRLEQAGVQIIPS